MASTPVKVLFVAANTAVDDAAGRAVFDEECAAIEDELKSTPARDQIVFRSHWAVTVDRLFRHLLSEEPTVVHFSGHGRADGIILKGPDGTAQPVSAEA